MRHVSGCDANAVEARKERGRVAEPMHLLAVAPCSRAAEVCEYHVQQAVQKRRAGRAEFFSGCVAFLPSAGSRPNRLAR